MSYESLYKIYRKYPQEWEDTFTKRKESDSAEVLDFSIHEFNRRPVYRSFFVYHKDIAQLLRQIERQHGVFVQLFSDVPETMHGYLVRTLLTEEIKASNDIEGVFSSRKELQSAYDYPTRPQRFTRVVSHYESLLQSDVLRLVETCEDMRHLYDVLVADEIKGSNQLDGQLFRADSVDVVSGSGKIIHRGIEPESEITRLVTNALDLLNDATLDLPIRVALFHYLFGYIHPFYDGNGRTNRYISSLYLAHEYHPFIGLRLSVLIKANQSKYYKMFKETTSEFNGGDLTAFIIEFLQFIHDTIQNVTDLIGKRVHRLKVGHVLLERFMTAHHITDDTTRRIYDVLLQTAMFSGGAGINRAELARVLGKSQKTINERIQLIPKEHMRIKKVGRTEYLSLNRGILFSGT